MVNRTDTKTICEVFLVHGRDEDANKGMRDFLRALRLTVLEWSEVKRSCKKPNPDVSEIVEKALRKRAVLVLMTPDEVVFLRNEIKKEFDTQEEAGPAVQPRPNVLLEGGFAWGLNPKHTVFVTMGKARVPSDILGKHIERFDGSKRLRKRLAEELKAAGCKVDMGGEDWLSAGKEYFETMLKRLENSDFVVERGIPAGVGIRESPYRFANVINKRCKRIIMTGHNFADVLDTKKGSVLQGVVKRALESNPALKISLVFAPPDLLKSAHRPGYEDLIKTSIPQLAELKYGHFLNEEQQRRIDICCLSGALSLSCFAIDHNDDNGLITVTPRWVTDETGSGRMFYAIRKSDNPMIYETMRKQIEVIVGQIRETHPTAKSFKDVVIMLKDEGVELNIAKSTFKKMC